MRPSAGLHGIGARKKGEPAAARLRPIGVKSHIAVAAAILACLLATACDSLPAAVTAASTTAPTAAGNRELAEHEAARLLSLTPVPDGAVRLGPVPRSLPGPALGTPGVTSLIDQVRSWRLPMTLAQATAWLHAHAPRGLRDDGSTTRWGPQGVNMIGYGYAGPGSPAWQSAELDIALAPAGSRASVLRADGVVVWLDPVPVPDSEPGRRMRVTVAGSCPASDAGFAGVTNPSVTSHSVTNHGADLARRLLPGGAPTAGLECRYAGIGGGHRLRNATRLNAAAAQQVAAPLAQLPLSHVDGGVTSCPADDGSAEVVALSYPHLADVDLWINLSGCGGVSNGHIVLG
jgi:hypothetical protein